MLAILAALFATLLHLAMIMLLAPMVSGIVAKLRARLQGRRGPPWHQPYLDLRRLLHKTTLIPENATELYQLWPYIAFGAITAAVLLIPSFCTGLITAPISDFISFIGLLALARAAVLLAGLETGFGFGAAGAARDVLFGIFSEAALLVVVLTFVLIAHSPTIDGVSVAFRDHQIGLSVSLGFALVALLSVALTETGRMPSDNPAGHLELAMVHEAMILEYSGRLLFLFQYAAMLRLTMWMTLIGAVFLPFGVGRAESLLSWPLGILLWGGKMVFLASTLAGFEIFNAKMRVFRVPEFLGLALLLGMLSSIFLFVAARLGV